MEEANLIKRTETNFRKYIQTGKGKTKCPSAAVGHKKVCITPCCKIRRNDRMTDKGQTIWPKLLCVVAIKTQNDIKSDFNVLYQADEHPILSVSLYWFTSIFNK